MKKIYYVLIFVVLVNSIVLGVVFYNRTQTPADEPEMEIIDESVLLDLPPFYSPEVEEAFRIYTLEEWYGDKVEEMVYLDPSVITHDELRFLRVLHVGFDGLIHEGEIIVNYQIAEEVLEIFRELYDIGFPIERMRVISEYDGCDYASMEDNNSHGFNFRKIAGTNIWSEHAFGLAIDINPIVNPFVRGDLVKPAIGMDYIDRDQEALGIIRKDEAVYRIFTSRGWIWGGDWADFGLRDYHHFERPLN